MELVTTFESLSKKVLEKYDGISITMGILIADYRQTDAREYILNYMNRFDELSGKYIDFYLPGYYMYAPESKNEWKTRSHENICISRHCSSNQPIYISRTGEKFYFDEYLFEEFLREFEKKTGIHYTYSAMLVLVEVNKSAGYGAIEFQDKMVIDLDDGTLRGIKRSGCLFEEIFAIARRNVDLEYFGKNMRLHYLKGNAVKTIAGILDGNLLETIASNVEGVRSFRIIKKDNIK